MQSERINFVFLKKSILSIYKKIVFPVLSQIDPEKVHYWAMGALVAALKMPIIGNIIKSSFNSKSEGLERDVFGLRFKNPIGLAAGFDKNAQWIDELATLGFGFIEIGTVTPKAQDGNPKPRLFRLKKDLALINRMGFNNGGVDKVVENLKKRKSDILVGGNIGKNKIGFKKFHYYYEKHFGISQEKRKLIKYISFLMNMTYIINTMLNHINYRYVFSTLTVFDLV